MKGRFAMFNDIPRGPRRAGRRHVSPIAAAPVESWSRAGCHCDPCSATTDPAMFFASAASRKIQSSLLTGLETRGGCIFLITGEAGMGKTMQLHALEAVLRVAGETVMVHDGADDSASWISRLTGSSRDAHGACIVDLIDAAEQCSVQTISRLTQAVWTAEGRGFHARLVIAARPELETHVYGLVAAALATRITFNWLRLDRVDAGDIEGFVTHRLRRSGFSGASPLSAPAVRRIIDGSAGVPRRILEFAAVELDAEWRRAMTAGKYADRSPRRRRTLRRGIGAATLSLLAAGAWLLVPAEMIHRAGRFAIETTGAGPWALAIQPRPTELAAISEPKRVTPDSPTRLDSLLPIGGEDDAPEDAHVAIVHAAHPSPATTIDAGNDGDTMVVHQPTESIAPPSRSDLAESDVALGFAITAATREPEAAPVVTVRASASPPRSSLSAEQVAALIRRGDEQVSEGGIAAARLFYERAAAAGDGRAMRALAHTYDPQELRRLGVVGLSADPERAQFWRRRADEAEGAAPRVP